MSKAGIAAKLGFDRGLFVDRSDIATAFAEGSAELEGELCLRILEKIRNGDLIALIFSLKARCGWREADKVKDDPDPATKGVKVLLPNNGRDPFCGSGEKTD